MKIDLFGFFRAIPNLSSPVLACGRRPVLVLSFPRCGSTWVGSVLAQAPYARYLQEPVNRVLANGKGYPFYSDPDESICTAIETAFRGWRWRNEKIMPYRHRWGLSSLLFGRLVIKEVALLSLPRLLEYQPQVILLRRHPVAVVRSFLDTKLLDEKGRDPLPNLSFVEDLDFRNDATLVTSLYGMYLRKTLDTLSAYRDKMETSFEALCVNPEEGFRALFDFARLKYSADISEFIATLQQSPDPSPFSVFKETSKILANQFDGIGPNEFAEIEEVWERYNLPWYGTRRDIPYRHSWSVETKVERNEFA